jgi:hypothetical protein
MKTVLDEFENFSNDEFLEFFKDLTIEKAEYYDFRRWSKESNLYLIPETFIDFIPIGQELISINGKKVIYNGNNIDTDTRFGLLAYGINIDKSIFYDGAIVSTDDVITYFEKDLRNDYLKLTYYHSKDGQWLATIYDGIDTVQIERNE